MFAFSQGFFFMVRERTIQVLNTVNDFCIVIFVNHSCHDSRQTEKINLDFYFHTSLWCLKCFYEGLKAFIKPQRSVKIKIQVNFYFITTFLNAQGGKG